MQAQRLRVGTLVPPSLQRSSGPNLFADTHRVVDIEYKFNALGECEREWVRAEVLMDRGHVFKRPTY